MRGRVLGTTENPTERNQLCKLLLTIPYGEFFLLLDIKNDEKESHILIFGGDDAKTS